MKMTNEILKLRGKSVVYATSLRIPTSERLEDLFYYDVRSSDENSGVPASIKRGVMVNHLGTIATTEPLLSPNETCWDLDDDISCLLGMYV